MPRVLVRRLVPEAPSAPHVPGLQPSRRKAVFGITHTVCAEF